MADDIGDRRVDLYEVLQVSSRASPEVVQAAYRALARAFHPDVNPTQEAANQMQQLNAAYGVLSDPAQRARYDTVRIRPRRARREVEAEPTPASGTRSTARTVYGRPITRVVEPPLARGGAPRLGRLLVGLLLVFLLLWGLLYSLYMVAGLLDDQPTRPMIPGASDVSHYTLEAPDSGAGWGVPADIASSARSSLGDASPFRGR